MTSLIEFCAHTQDLIYQDHKKISFKSVIEATYVESGVNCVKENESIHYRIISQI